MTGREGEVEGLMEWVLIMRWYVLVHTKTWYVLVHTNVVLVCTGTYLDLVYTGVYRLLVYTGTWECEGISRVSGVSGES